MQRAGSLAVRVRAVRIFQASLNILIVLLFALCAYVSYRHFVTSRSLQSLGIVAVNSLFLALFLTRRRATAESSSLALWVLGFSGTALPLLLRPSDVPGLVRVGTLVQIVGMVMIIAGLLSLRRSFGVVPGNRGIQVGGLYRLVRHPIYISEIVAVLGTVLVNPTPANWLLWIAECGLQVARSLAEENLLVSDPVYRSYRARVRYRLIPGLV